MNGFTDTDKELGWASDSVEDMDKAIAQIKADGFFPWPHDQALPQDGFEYAFYGPLAFSKPEFKK